MGSRNDDRDPIDGGQPPSMKRATVAALILATVGGAWTFRDYLSGKLSHRGEPAVKTPSTEHHVSPPPPVAREDEKDKDKWRNKTKPDDLPPTPRIRS
jgi:hypothetical protein